MLESGSGTNKEPPASTIRSARTDRIKAIGLMCLAVTMFGVLDTTAKYLGSVSQLPVLQIVWLRFISQFALVVIILGPVAVLRHSKTNHRWAQLTRSTLLLTATTLNFLSLQHLRLDQTTTMFFLTPLTIALLAGPVLGEWIGWRRFVAILVGFIGIVVSVRPGFTAVHPAFALSLGAMLAYASFSLITRHLSKLDSSETTLLYSMIAGMVLIAPIALTGWVWPDPWWIWLILLSMGMWGGIGHYLFILANRLAPASIVAPFVYVSLLSNSVLGYLVFDDVPDHWTLIGASIVIMSGLYLFWREQAVRDQDS